MDRQLYCPYCTKEIATIVGKTIVDSPKGLVAICVHCLELVIFDNNNTLRKLTKDEHDAIKGDLTVVIIKMYAAMLRRRAAANYN